MKKTIILAAMATLSLAANAEEAKKDSVNPRASRTRLALAPAGTTLPSPTSRQRF